MTAAGEATWTSCGFLKDTECQSPGRMLYIFCHLCKIMLMLTLKPCRKGKLGSGATGMMRSMRTALQRCMQHCQRALAGAAAPSLGKADVVHACADLDIAYYALLEHHLSCGYGMPPVPPPHIYFPALARAHPGACLLREALHVVQLCRKPFP